MNVPRLPRLFLIKCWGSNENSELGIGRNHTAPNDLIGDAPSELGDNLIAVDLGTQGTCHPTAAPTDDPTQIPTPSPTKSPLRTQKQAETLSPKDSQNESEESFYQKLSDIEKAGFISGIVGVIGLLALSCFVYQWVQGYKLAAQVAYTRTSISTV